MTSVSGPRASRSTRRVARFWVKVDLPAPLIPPRARTKAVPCSCVGGITSIGALHSSHRGLKCLGEVSRKRGAVEADSRVGS